MNCVLPDTNVLIELFAGDKTFAEELNQADRIVIPTIVYGEILMGLDKSRRGRTQRAMFEKFLRNPVVECVDLTRIAGIYYAEIHRLLKEKGHPIPLNDMWIAASALEQGAELLTFDTHFLHIPILQCSVRA